MCHVPVSALTPTLTQTLFPRPVNPDPHTMSMWGRIKYSEGKWWCVGARELLQTLGGGAAAAAAAAVSGDSTRDDGDDRLPVPPSRDEENIGPGCGYREKGSRKYESGG